MSVPPSTRFAVSIGVWYVCVEEDESLYVLLDGECVCVRTPTDRIGWWWFEMEFGLCVIMIIYLYALPAYHITSYHLSLEDNHTPTHTNAHTHTQQIESSKSWLFASNDLDDDGLRWCADLFVTARLISHIIKLCTSVCVHICCIYLLLCMCFFKCTYVCPWMCVWYESWMPMFAA